jgi:hypothetical protein
MHDQKEGINFKKGLIEEKKRIIETDLFKMQEIPAF